MILNYFHHAGAVAWPYGNGYINLYTYLPSLPAEVLPVSPQNALFISKTPKEHNLCPENELYGGKNEMQLWFSTDVSHWLYHVIEQWKGLFKSQLQSMVCHPAGYNKCFKTKASIG